MAASENCESAVMVDEIIANRKNSNLILKLEDLLRYSRPNDEDVQLTIASVRRLFLHFLEKKEICTDEDNKKNEQNAEETYKCWLKERYDDFRRHLLVFCKHRDVNIQMIAMDVLMDFIHAEGKYPTNTVAKERWYFPKTSFQAVIECLVAKNKDMTTAIAHFHTYLKDDIKLYTWKALHEILLKPGEKEMHLLLNIYMLLTKMQYPRVLTQTDGPKISDNVFIVKEGDQKFILKKKVFSKAFSDVWILYLKCKIPIEVYKSLLIYLPKRVLPFLNDPLLLTDFLTDSYHAGGVTSVLALNSIYYLIQNYNLEYPDFYIKLYSLFTQKVITGKYRARFFYLADLFLSSTHLTAYLVASFVKRLSRLALFVSPDVALIILPFIGNLLIRHRSLHTLIHRPDGELAMDQDPYNFEQPDPAKTEALQSSLWEIKSLQKHWHPDVSKKAQFINYELPRIEYDLLSVIHLTMDDVMTKEFKRKPLTIPMSYNRPSGLFQRAEDAMNNMWNI